jgi:hypothetical protein
VDLDSAAAGAHPDMDDHRRLRDIGQRLAQTVPHRAEATVRRG